MGWIADPEFLVVLAFIFGLGILGLLARIADRLDRIHESLRAIHALAKRNFSN